MGDAAIELDGELDRMRRVGERIEKDDEFRERVTVDPVGALTSEGLPEAEVEAFLRSLDGTPEEVLEKATSDVEAHTMKKLTP